jgi:hypothetical protein
MELIFIVHDNKYIYSTYVFHFLSFREKYTSTNYLII